jgi:outer membrane protein assembly factor BamD (BamD/ComL family)
VASDLGEQNDFFATALAAKKRGAAAEAIQGFEAFVARYPSSSLVESALAQRMKLLRGVDAGRAKRAAAEYLARYPRGFARADAEAIERQAP